MGRIKKSKSMLLKPTFNVNNSISILSIPNSSNYSADNFNYINIKQIHDRFVKPFIDRNIEIIPPVTPVFNLLEKNRALDPSKGIVTDFLIDIIISIQNSQKLFANITLNRLILNRNELKLEECNKKVCELLEIIENRQKKECNPLAGYLPAKININPGKPKVIPVLSKLALVYGTPGLVAGFYHLYYFGFYDPDAIIDPKKLKFITNMVFSIGLTPDPETGISPALKKLQEMEQAISRE